MIGKREPGIFRLYWDAAGRHRKLYLVGALALLIVNLLDLIPPLLVGRLVDSVQTQADDWIPLVIAGLFMGVIIFQNLFRYPMRMYFRGTSAKVTAEIRDRYMRRLLRLSPEFYGKQTTGDLMSRATNDIEAVDRAMGIGFLLIIDTIIYLSTIPVVMIFISPTLTLYAFALMPLVPIFVYTISRLIDKTFEEVQDIFGEMSARAQQNASGVQVIRAYGAEQAEIGEFDRTANRFVKRSLTLARLEAMFWPGINLFLGVGMFAVLYFGGGRTLRGEMTLGEMVTFVHYMHMLIWPLMTLGWTITLAQRGRASLRRIRAIVDSPEEIADGPQGIGSVRGRIEFRNLTYRYPGSEEPALENVSLFIEPGETLAVVGPVGSGKSTLIELLTRMYDPPEGTVFIDGIDVRTLRLADLRRQLAVAPQESFLFNDPIRDNIRLGGEAVEASTAARMAQLQVRDFPDGIDTMLGERGVNLSGGQKQRVALARALTRGAPVLVLDDTLSAVDAETEERIVEELRAARKDRTCIMISHRVRTAQEAERVAVLDQGRLVELGTHEELSARRGLYSDLVRQQSWVFNGE